MSLFCPYSSDFCIYTKLKYVNCHKCIWQSYGHNSEFTEEQEEEENFELLEKNEEDYEVLFPDTI